MILTNPFIGLITALITPFKNDTIDYIALKNLLNYQIDSGIKAVVIAGSTGEGSALTACEYKELVSNAVTIAKSRINIIAGCTAISTATTISIAKISEEVGANGLMCSPPPYNRPTQQGLIEHFKALHNSTNLPIMLYSAPSRAGIDFIDSTIIELSNLPRILALKDCAGDIERPLRILNKVNSNFNILSGDDSLSLAYNAQGAIGLVSVASNIFPKEMLEVQNNWNDGNIRKAITLQQKFLNLYKALFMETNPIPIKFATSTTGLCGPEIRLPLIEASENCKAVITKLVSEFKR